MEIRQIMTCGKNTTKNLKDAADSVRHALIHALENKEETVVSDLFDLYNRVSEVAKKTALLTTNNIMVDTSNYDTIATNAPFSYGGTNGGNDYINFAGVGGDSIITGGESSDTISF